MNGQHIVGRARLPNYRETINSVSNLGDGIFPLNADERELIPTVSSVDFFP
jgi:hypothetical protein